MDGKLIKIQTGRASGTIRLTVEVQTDDLPVDTLRCIGGNATVIFQRGQSVPTMSQVT